MQYRPEIDGLRAVAVLPVILFHAGFSVFSGGFVGVDIFFVISGYLITSILISDIQQGNFSIARFYERRARRILPALFVVMLTCLPFAYMWMMPSQLKDFGQSLVAVVFFASNILFWRESGYFAAAAELKPLLHTWSLAVEEQYYLLFPLFLLLVWRFGRKRALWSVAVLAVLSLLLAEWGWRNTPVANFYLAPTRAWELLAGSICAFLSEGRSQRSSNFLSIAGLALIVFAIFAYSDSTPFPSVYTLVPVLGTALIILFSSEGTWAARLLSLRGFVGIGLISYSAYLWHQPLFAFARLRSLTAPNPVIMGALAIAALFLAWATWYWIEQAFRKPTKPLVSSQRSVFVASGFVGIVFVVLGLAGHAGKGFEWRFDANTLRYIAAKSDKASYQCHLGPRKLIPSHPMSECLFPNGEGAVNVLLTGDSHALAVSEVLGESLRRKNIGYYDLNYSSCPPIPSLRRFNAAANAPNYMCDDFIRSVLEYAGQNDVEVIVLSARYPLYLLGNKFNNGEGGVEIGEASWVDLSDRVESEWNDNERRMRVLDAYERQIRKLATQFKVVLVYPVPEAGWNVPIYGFKNAYFNDNDETLTTSYAIYRERAGQVHALFDRLANEIPTVFGARVHEALCNDATGRCLNADKNGVYYYDDDHLSNSGARLVAPVILKEIQDAL